MTVGSYQAFYNMVKDDQPAIGKPLGDCLRSLSGICACRKQQKTQKSNECNQLYINFVKTSGEALKEYFATKTTDAEILFSHDSHHEILRLKLR